MKLTRADFDKIRPIEWIVKDVGGTLMNTPMNQTFNRLFWLDFFRYVFAPKFRQQSGVVSVSSFDLGTPVLLTNDMNLQLPTILETVIYYYENAKSAPIEFKINTTQAVPMIVAVLILLCILVFAMFVTPPIDSSAYRIV